MQPNGRPAGRIPSGVQAELDAAAVRTGDTAALILARHRLGIIFSLSAVEPGDVELLEAAGVPEFSDEPEGATCPACGGDGAELGALGHLMHYRCSACGMGFSHEVQR